MDKVYCKGCTHSFYDDNGITRHCECPELTKYRDTPYERVPIYGKCNDINKDNDCKHYEKWVMTGWDLLP